MKPEDVPAGPLLVDTDVVSYWVLKADQAAAFTELVAGRPQAISFATYGELLAIGHKLTWGERRLNELRAHLKTFVVLPYQASVVELCTRSSPVTGDCYAPFRGGLGVRFPRATRPCDFMVLGGHR